MAKVLCLSSQVVWGPVGNTAAVPALQALGHEVLQVPTILLSHHPGHGKPVTRATSAEDFAALVAAVEDKGGLADCAAIMTGYFASAEQVGIAAGVISRLRRANPSLVVLVDPVMGDHGRLYVAQDIAAAIRDELLPLAGIVTPNVFELSWLTGEIVSDAASAAAAARQLPCSEVLVTSIAIGGHSLGTLLLTGDATHLKHTAKLEHVPHGTGDFLAGAYLAARLRQAPKVAFGAAMTRLAEVIASSSGMILQNT
jgi:pyridoxine kinase